MKPEIIKNLSDIFQDKVLIDKDGVEFWYARDLQKLLGYIEWRNFQKIIRKAQNSCKKSGVSITEHFVDVNKSIKSGNGAMQEIVDLKLTRYACYLIAQNGDPDKTEIAFAQAYFAIQTRNYELIQERINDLERIKAREKLSRSEKQLSGIIFEVTKDERAFGIIRSKGDRALFGINTDEMKKRWKVPKYKPLADYSPTLVLKGKDFANEMTVHNTREKNLKTKNFLSIEHVENNATVRKAMIDRGIVPESLPPEKDVIKVKKILNKKD